MLPTAKLYTRNFYIAAVSTLLIAIVILWLSFTIGKDEFFLLLNGDQGKVADFFFNYFTYVGDGLLWIIWLVVFLRKKKRHLLPLIITSFVATTLFVQVGKQVILPNEPRPSEAIHNAPIHYIDGILIHSINSFPSGHTATAFTFALLIALLSPSLALTVGCLLAALVVGYTRIYQGQHFPLDIGGGIMVSVAAVWLALLAQQYADKRRIKKSRGL